MIKKQIGAIRAISAIGEREGGVPVSTGVWSLDERAAAPDRHKTGNFIN